MGRLGGDGRRLRRGLALLLATGAFVLLVASAGANLPLSGFDAGDGNLAVDDEAFDWANVGIDCTSAVKVGCAIDKPTGQQDDSFGQGTSEDSAIPSVVDGSIPNNKSDLTRFYVSTKRENGKSFLQLAWERVQEPTGTTNMDFEFDQNSCDPTSASYNCSSNGVTPTRKAGDVLIKYDLSQGGTNPVLGYLLWVTSGSTSQCESSNKLPCWGKVQSLTGDFEGAINTAPTTDPINPDAPRTLSARTFGEAAINLSDSQLFPANQCVNFGSAYLKSRSSDSFTAAVKDFIAPVPVSVSNCATIIVRKQTNPQAGTGSPTFNFTTTGSGLSAFGLKDDGVKPFAGLFEATYSVTESDPASDGYRFDSVSCSTGGGGSTATPSNGTRSVSISLKAGDTVDCTFTNSKLPTLTVSKVCNPSGDLGKFNLQIDSANAGTGANAGCGGTTGAVVVSIGGHGVGETAGTGTSLGNYLTPAIGGDCAANGSITLAAGDNKTCTITNTRKPTLTVTKVCNPTTDDGKFNLQIDGSTAGTGANAACGGSTGAVQVSIGGHGVGETAGDLTDLGDYLAPAYGGACDASGNVTLGAGENKTCTITNTRKATLTVTKVCVPTTDDGKFNLQIDGATPATGANAACGGSTDAVQVSIGSHTVGETAGNGTSLGDYLAPAYGGACDGSGNVSLAAGENKTCTITNTRKPTLTVNKVCDPISDQGKFNLRIDGATAGTGANAGCGGSTGAVQVSIASHVVGETAGSGTNLSDYTSVITGDCATNGSVTLTAGQNKVCTITNTRRVFTVITVVCEGSSLYSSSVTLDGVTRASFATAPSGFTASGLCGLGAGPPLFGARFPGLVSGTHTGSVVIVP